MFEGTTSLASGNGVVSGKVRQGKILDSLRTLPPPFSKVRRNPFPAPFSLKINAPSLITNLRKLSFLSVSNRQNRQKRQFTHMSFLYFVQIYRAFILPKE